MATIQSRRDMGYVPTPPAVMHLLAQWFQVPANLHAIDPCCGTGEALRTLSPKHGNLYGIELSMARAMAAKKVLTKVIAGDALAARISHSSMGMVFCNPPYDDSTEGRLELRFLERAVNWLVPGGVLIYIIKRDRYSERVMKVLAKNFTLFRHFRFPDPYYRGPELDFGQTVLICKRSHNPYPPNIDYFQRDHLGLRVDVELPELAPPPNFGAVYRMPPGEYPSVFVSGQLDVEDLAELLKASPLSVRPPIVEFKLDRPPLPLEDGHVALALASGAIDGIFGTGPTLHCSKGTVTRAVHKDQRAALIDREGGAGMLIETTTDTFQVQVRTLHPDGTISNLTGDPLIPKDDSEDQEADDADRDNQ